MKNNSVFKVISIIVFIAMLFLADSLQSCQSKEKMGFKKNTLYESDLGLNLFFMNDSVVGFSEYSTYRSSCSFYFTGRKVGDSTYAIILNPDTALVNRLGFAVADSCRGQLFVSGDCSFRLVLPKMVSGCGNAVPVAFEKGALAFNHQVSCKEGHEAVRLAVADTRQLSHESGLTEKTIVVVRGESGADCIVQYKWFRRLDEYNVEQRMMSDTIKRNTLIGLN